jgi:hypothetical protein
MADLFSSFRKNGKRYEEKKICFGMATRNYTGGEFIEKSKNFSSYEKL